MSNSRRLRRSIAQAGNAVTDQRPGAHHYRDKQAFAGRENVYTCKNCRGWIVTIDRDPGVTPMFLACRAPQATGEIPCRGEMVSAGYPSGPKPPQYGPPTWEWFRPDSTKGMDPAMADHIHRGGLELREIKQRGASEVDRG